MAYGELCRIRPKADYLAYFIECPLLKDEPRCLSGASPSLGMLPALFIIYFSYRPPGAAPDSIWEPLRQQVQRAPEAFALYVFPSMSFLSSKAI
jgi:hypothetical protein